MASDSAQSFYTGKVVVDPVTRIEGHLKVEVEVENGRVKEARSAATLFRGLEIILKGRDPRDAQHFTQRVCGVCTYVHALASTRALESAAGALVPKNATLLRNLVLAAHFLHDHIVHFYTLHSLDFVDLGAALKADPARAASLAATLSPRPSPARELKEVQDKFKALAGANQPGPFANAYSLGGHPAYRLSPELNLVVAAHYLEALRVQVKVARAMAAFGAKNPHPQFTIAGGVSCYEAMTPPRLREFLENIRAGADFIKNAYLPDLLAIAAEYKDWTGYGGSANFMALGSFPQPGADSLLDENDLARGWFKPGLILGRKLDKIEDFDPANIREHVRHSWYKGGTARAPFEGETVPAFTRPDDADRYSWSKAPRYDGKTMETGPLAQMLVSYAQGHPQVTPALDRLMAALSLDRRALNSTLGRTAARAVQASLIAAQIPVWLGELDVNVRRGDTVINVPFEVPDEGEGVGFVGAPRGGLSHWLRIEGGEIANFQLVVPSTWNFGPRCAANIPGPLEQALAGTPIADPARPVELLRTIHSFDPCLACAVHVIDPVSNEERVFRAFHA
ncbi:MAG: nickel-dependent hydrogenase large subunit [Deltaproteobacteria bacterium]|jgi:[NiFe] hydrogenase large subunit|nr:nickel-dependent hydrogenase large subunit [Deltaproteobacteria bacterium]